MAGVVVGSIGIDKIMAQLEKKLVQNAATIDREIQRAGANCERYAKIACPVDTGNLRASITYENGGFQKAFVSTNVIYAPFVEWGTSRQAPQPYLYPAYEDAKKDLMEALKKKL